MSPASAPPSASSSGTPPSRTPRLTSSPRSSATSSATTPCITSAWASLFTGLLLLVAFFLGQKLTQWTLRRFGPRWHIHSQNDWACLAVLLLVLNTLSFLAAPIENAFSRSIEHAADVYGQEAIHGIVANPQTVTQQAFQRLGEASLEDPTPHPFVEFWTYSHPSIASRAAFAAAYNPWTAGQHPKYFLKKMKLHDLVKTIRKP